MSSTDEPWAKGFEAMKESFGYRDAPQNNSKCNLDSMFI